MGWIRDAPGCEHHEGFAVALVELEDRPGSGLLRALRYPYDEAERRGIGLAQAGCDCGWRSQVIRVSAGRWGPFSLVLAEGDEDRIRHLWQQHVHNIACEEQRLEAAHGIAFWRNESEAPGPRTPRAYPRVDPAKFGEPGFVQRTLQQRSDAREHYLQSALQYAAHAREMVVGREGDVASPAVIVALRDLSQALEAIVRAMEANKG